jgi:hypothetical protein
MQASTNHHNDMLFVDDQELAEQFCRQQIGAAYSGATGGTIARGATQFTSQMGAASNQPFAGAADIPSKSRTITINVHADPGNPAAPHSWAALNAIAQQQGPRCLPALLHGVNAPAAAAELVSYAWCFPPHPYSAQHPNLDEQCCCFLHLLPALPVHAARWSTS